METLSGTVNHVIYYNEENGFTVLSLSLDSEHKKLHKAIGNNVCCTGVIERKPYDDEEYELTGEWINNPKYGKQFKFESYNRPTANTAIGIINYLSSDLFPGIGIKIASDIYDHFGKDSLKVIKEHPEKLKEINIKQSKIDILTTGIRMDEHSSKNMLFLLDNGITPSMAKLIITKMEELHIVNIIESIKQNPYQLMDYVDHFGFIKADELANSLHIDKFSEIRMRALLSYLVKEELFNTGNSYLMRSDLHAKVSNYIGNTINDELFDSIIDYGMKNHKIYIDSDNRIFDYHQYKYETDLALELVKLLIYRDSKDSKEFTAKDIEKAYNKVVKKSAITFNPEQIDAIKSAFLEPLVIITGGPGTGKTTIIKAILNLYVALNNDHDFVLKDVALLAPTGRAAKRLSESTGLTASTIHRFLEYQGDDYFGYNINNKTTAKLLIVDEASMMDTVLASHLITSMADGARIIIVGDVDQLPSVGPGQVLKDLIESKEFKTVRLTKIHRQAEDSSIITLARSVNEGYLPTDILDKLKDRSFLNINKADLQHTIVDVFKIALDKGYSVKDVQVLIPMYRGPFGITEVNNALQEMINPLKEGELELKNLGRILRVNDKVIQLNNRAEKGIMNGDIGYIDSFKMENGKINGLVVLFDKAHVEFELNELEDISLAYAISVHKSQGSEFPVVIIPFDTSFFIMQKRKLIYTAITRCKDKLIMLGDVKALNTGIKIIEANRSTILKEEIKRYLQYDRGKLMPTKIEDQKEELKETKKTSPKKGSKKCESIGEEEFEL